MRNIPLHKVFMNPGVTRSLGEVLNSGFIGQGQKVERFEHELSMFLGHPAPVTVNSATSGLTLALRLITNNETDGEVLTQPITCTATNWAILAANQHLKWIDTDPVTGNMDLEDLRANLSERTRVIMLVHWAGQPVDLDRVKQIQDECYHLYGHRPIVIEDAAHAFGAEWDGMKLGNHGNFVVYSFQAIKHLTCGDGGALLCPQDDLYLPRDEQATGRAKLLRWYGLDRTKSEAFRCNQEIFEWGYKFHMNDINATIGLENLPSVNEVLELHRLNAAYYDLHLASVPGIIQLHTPKKALGAHWIYTVRVENRENLQRKLQEAGIASGQVHKRNDNYYAVDYYKSNRELPGTNLMSEQMLSIPCGWWVTPEDREYIVKTIKSGW
jgi:dTDP-4-amino-4,6-dideoxygalactose transaminase